MKTQSHKQVGFTLSAALLVFGLFQATPALAESLEELENCESCHAEQASEFEASVHYINRTGVQAGCNNCHAGKQHENGKDTSKTVQKSRMAMAISEWMRMDANGSKECKTCHSSMAMDLAKQEPRSVQQHEEAFDEDRTSCIECHHGISHYLPAGWKEKAKSIHARK